MQHKTKRKIIISKEKEQMFLISEQQEDNLYLIPVYVDIINGK